MRDGESIVDIVGQGKYNFSIQVMAWDWKLQAITRTWVEWA